MFYLDDSNQDVEHFDVEQAEQSYQNCFVPLLYHELWTGIVYEYKSLSRFESPIIVKVQSIVNSVTLDKQELTATLIGTYNTELGECATVTIRFVLPSILFVLLDDPLAIVSHRLVLFDLVLIIIGPNYHFGIVLDVSIHEIAPHATHKPKNDNTFHINLMTKVGVYVSRKCSTAFEAQRNYLKSPALQILKITNIKSIRSMINAVHNLSNWPQHRSILKPTSEDPYFQLPENFDRRNKERIPGFNPTQSKVIRLAECMDDDIQERLHMVHGPPGKDLFYY